MSEVLRVLIVEDSDDDAVLLVRELRRGGYDVTFTRADTPTAMNAALDSGQWDIVIADYSMPYFSAPAALTLLQERGLDLPFIIVSGTIGEATAVAAMKAGAHDYLMKSDLVRLVSTIERELREAGVRLARQQAEEALHKSEKRFRLLVEGVKDYAIFMIDVEGHIASWNIGAERILGYQEAEIVDQPFSCIFTPEDIALGEEEQELRTAAAEGRALDERWHIRQDGTLFWASGIVTAIRDQQGKLQGFSKILRDITERKQAEEALQASEKFSRQVIESCTDCVKILGLDGRLISMNANGQKLMEITDIAPFLNKLCFEFWPIDESAKVQEAVKVARAGSIKKFNGFCPTAAGTPKWWDVVVTPILDKESSVVRLLSVARDVTERQQTEEALQKSEAKFRRLSESNIVGVMIAKNNGNIKEANDALLKMIGYTQSELVAGKICWRQITPLEHLPNDERAITQIKQTGACMPFEKEYIRKDGSRVPVLIGSALLEGSQDTAIYFILDITERKQAEEQIKAALQEKEVLLQEIHHRVKNNLQVISSLLNLQSKYIQDQESLEIFKESQNRINSMALIHEKLYQSKNLANINFNQYIRNLAADLLNSYQVRPGATTLKCRNEKVFLKVDTAVPCGLIVNELVANSLKHAFPTSESGEIYTGIYLNDDNNFELFVHDDGVGFPKNLDFRNTKSLGLQLVNTLARQLKGKVEFTHRNGTEFKVVFPNK